MQGLKKRNKDGRNHFLLPDSCSLLLASFFPLSCFPLFQVAVKWYYYEKEAHHPFAPDCTLSDLLQ